MKLSVIATITTVAALIVSPATAYAEDPVPTTDEVLAAMAELTDPNIPAANKGNIVSPGSSPDEAGTITDHLNEMNAKEALPLNFVVTDIQPAPNGLAGATVAATGGYLHRNSPQPIVLTDQGGHWLITHDTAMTALDAYYSTALHPCICGGLPGARRNCEQECQRRGPDGAALTLPRHNAPPPPPPSSAPISYLTDDPAPPLPGCAPDSTDPTCQPTPPPPQPYCARFWRIEGRC